MNPLRWLFRLLAYPFSPPNTVESVAREIIEGVENGTVIIHDLGLEDDSADDHDQQDE